jgi:hypothetical protein
MSQVDAYRMLHPGLDVVDAVAELQAIQALNREDADGRAEPAGGAQ